MKTNNQLATFCLEKDNIDRVIGKAVKWGAPGYASQRSEGIAVIIAANFDQRCPFIAKNILGDDIEYAFLSGTDICYSDEDRPITIHEIWDLGNPDEYAAYREALREYCAYYTALHYLYELRPTEKDGRVEWRREAEQCKSKND